MGERFDIQVNSQAGTTTLCLSGQIDINAGRAVRGAVADATFGCRPQTLIVDLTDTTFLDSSAITALILARHLAGHGERQLPPDQTRAPDPSDGGFRRGRASPDS
jgi:anti-anti-sigma factor